MGESSESSAMNELSAAFCLIVLRVLLADGGVGYSWLTRRRRRRLAHMYMSMYMAMYMYMW